LKKRGTGYGIFNAAYCLAVFIGSSIIGFLYEFSLPAVIFLSIALEIASLILFFIMRKEALK